MKLLVDELLYKDDCLFADQKWNCEKESWVTYCQLTGKRCDLDVNKEECSCLKAKKDE